VSLISFLHKQFISVVQWNEPEDGILAYHYPMQELEIQIDGQLTVRESQMAMFVHEGKIADVFGPGLHTLAPRNLPPRRKEVNLGFERCGRISIPTHHPGQQRQIAGR
jgi:membrane protease subunit (stomatin/prohibitin family)